MTKRYHFSLTLFLISLPIFSFSVQAEDKVYDYVIKGALVFDGESLMPVKRDIAILGDRIAQTGQIPPEEAKEVIEAGGLVSSPGFIDTHTHSDFNPLVYPDLGNKVLQGVTTEVVGNCGMSAAPVEGSLRDEIHNIWKREGVEIPKDISWTTFKEYQNDLEFQGLETNFMGLVGHGNIRSSVMGMDRRAARPRELEAMKEMLDQALEEGAAGISFGLVYLPGVFAAPEEILSLCQVAAKRDRLCIFHMRSEGRELPEAVDEALDAARKTGAKVHISHLKAAGGKNWAKIHEVFRKIEAARAQGLRVTADAYPYTASFAELGVVLPDEIYQDPNRASRFKDPAKREETLKILATHFESHPASWDKIRIATVTSRKNASFQGKTLQEMAEKLNQPPLEVLVNLLAQEDFKVSAFFFSQDETVVQEVLSKPYITVGSDSIADGSLMPHPRAFGTFPRFLNRCSKQRGVMEDPCWGEAIYRMTGLPARIFGLQERGRIGTGLAADLVLFDPSAIRDRADYQNPKSVPEGIRWVFVNGKPVVKEGKYAPVHSGVFLLAEK